MALRGLVAVVLVVALWEGATAQSSGCTNTLISLSPCLNYITGNTSTPSSSCCSQLGSVVSSQPQCLCQVLNGGGSSLGININQTQALALPGACKVQTPSISKCSGASPSDSPAGTPASPAGTPASPAGTPASPDSDSPDTKPSGTGSKNVPTTEGAGSSDASSITMALPLTFILMFVASYVSISAL